jgi:hypothetical protein
MSLDGSNLRFILFSLLFGGGGVQEWRLARVSCFRTDQDGPATSDDGSGLNYLAQSESSWASEAKDGGSERSSGEEDWNYSEGGWFVRVQKVSLFYLLPLSFTGCSMSKYFETNKMLFLCWIIVKRNQHCILHATSDSTRMNLILVI